MTTESTRSPGSKRRPESSDDSAEQSKPGDAGKATQTLYRDRPTDDGKQGDGDQEPNEGFPHA